MSIERLSSNAWQRLRAVRLAALTDAPEAFCSTLEQCRGWEEARWRVQLDELATFVATHEGSDVGLVRGAHHEAHPSVAWLLSMWVAPQARRLGLGRALIEAVADWAESVGKTELWLDVREGNDRAAVLYRAEGFVQDPKPVGSTRGGVPEFRYRRSLTAARAR